MTHRARAAFTLWEMTTVLLVMTVVVSLTAPALVRFGLDRPAGSADALLAVLRSARALALSSNSMVTLRLDPTTLRYEADTSGIVGAGVAAAGVIAMSPSLTLQTDKARLTYVFRPSGAAFADSVIVRGGPTPVWVGVDPWSGAPRAEAR